MVPNPYTMMGLIPTSVAWFICLEFICFFFLSSLAPISQSIFTFQREDKGTTTLHLFGMGWGFLHLNKKNTRGDKSTFRRHYPKVETNHDLGIRQWASVHGWDSSGPHTDIKNKMKTMHSLMDPQLRKGRANEPDTQTITEKYCQEIHLRRDQILSIVLLWVKCTPTK